MDRHNTLGKGKLPLCRPQWLVLRAAHTTMDGGLQTVPRGIVDQGAGMCT
jgi:hypothetical protein